MTLKQALELIVRNEHVKALNYAINYAKYALGLIKQGNSLTASDGTTDWISYQMETQLLYVLNNMTHWRESKLGNATSSEIREVRDELRYSLTKAR